MKKKLYAACIALLGIVSLSIGACLNPIGFSPDLKLSIDANVTGQLDMRSIDYAIVWLINKTKSVDVEELRISREMLNTDEAYVPTVVTLRPRAGTSHASYEVPTDKIYSLSLKWKPAASGWKGPIDSNNTMLTDAECTGSVSLEKQFPKSGYQYRLYLVRDAANVVRIVDEDELAKIDLNDKDKTNPPEPPDNETNSNFQTLIVKNRFSSKLDITTLALEDKTGTSMTLSLKRSIHPGDSFQFKVLKGDYDVTADVSTGQVIKSGSISIQKDLASLAAQNNTLYLYRNFLDELHFTSEENTLASQEKKVGIIDIDVYNDTGYYVKNYRLIHNETGKILADQAAVPKPHGVEGHRTDLHGKFTLNIILEHTVNELAYVSYELNATEIDEKYSFWILDNDTYPYQPDRFIRFIRKSDFGKIEIPPKVITYTVQASGGPDQPVISSPNVYTINSTSRADFVPDDYTSDRLIFTFSDPVKKIEWPTDQNPAYGQTVGPHNWHIGFRKVDAAGYVWETYDNGNRITAANDFGRNASIPGYDRYEAWKVFRDDSNAGVLQQDEYKWQAGDALYYWSSSPAPDGTANAWWPAGKLPYNGIIWRAGDNGASGFEPDKRNPMLYDGLPQNRGFLSQCGAMVMVYGEGVEKNTVIDPTLHSYVFYTKQVHTAQKTTRVFYMDAGLGRGEFAVPNWNLIPTPTPLARYANHDLEWYMKVKEVEYSDNVPTGVERIVIYNNIGSWVIDGSNNSAKPNKNGEYYVRFVQSGNWGSRAAALRIGNWESGTYMKEDAPPRTAGKVWNFITGLDFNPDISKITPIENMPYEDVPLYILGFQVGSVHKSNYKSITIPIRN
jgi:hypothetical protein